ncbi:MAG TPA: VRR-NUC domain-containing protein [Terriglobales bacterium]|nr:VRR-NUC domain-containing protein [Terriglobales bacterium]
MRFRKVGADPAFGNKPIVEWDGESFYPELAVARLLRRHGFDAVWIDSYRGKFWEGMLQQRTLPDAAREVYARILQANGGKRGGFWDVMAWKESEFVFIELKQNTPECKDRISGKQRNWLQAALRAGLNSACFYVCEWGYSAVSG